jgi:hypothetical protein
MTTIIDTKAMVKAYLRYEASRVRMDRREAPSNNGSISMTKHDFIAPSMVGFLDIRSLLNFGVTCKQHHAVASREVQRREKAFFAEFIAEIRDVVEAMIKAPPPSSPQGVVDLEFFGDDIEVDRAVSIRKSARTYLLNLISDTLVVMQHDRRMKIKRSDVDHAIDCYERNAAIGMFDFEEADAESIHADIEAAMAMHDLDNDEDDDDFVVEDDDATGMLDDEEEDEKAIQAEWEADMDVSDSDEDDDDYNVNDDEVDDNDDSDDDNNCDEVNNIVSGGDLGFKGLKMTKRDSKEFKKFLRPIINELRNDVPMDDDSVAALKGAMYSFLVTKFAANIDV